MHLALLAAVALVAAPPAAAPKAGAPVSSPHLAAGKAALAAGDFAKALKELDAAVAEAADEPALSRVHLLRGQCHAILRDIPKAEDAFARALELDPEATLDASVVRPSIVAILDKVRSRLTAELNVHTDEVGAALLFDGRKLGQAPMKTLVPIGRHKVEVRTADGRSESQEVVLKPRGSHELWIKVPPAAAAATPPVILPPPLTVQQPPLPPSVEKLSEGGSGIAPFADLRGVVEPRGGNPLGEVGVGVGFGRHVLVSAHFTAGHAMGATARLTASFPELFSVVGLYGSLDLPALFVQPKAAFGVGVAGGAQFAAAAWLEPFVEVAGRRFLTLPDGYNANYLLVGAGVRLRIP